MQVTLTKVKRFTDGNIRGRFDLDDGESDAILAAKGCRGQASTRYQKKLADEALARVMSQGEWIVCDCLEVASPGGIPSPIVLHGVTPPKITALRAPPAGPLVPTQATVVDPFAPYRHQTYIARNPNYPDHDKECPLYRDRSVTDLNQDLDPADPMDNRPKEPISIFGILKNPRESLSQEAQAKKRNGSGRRRKQSKQSHRLATVLATLFRAAGLDGWNGAAVRSVESDFSVLKSAMVGMAIDDNGKQLLSDWTVTRSTDLPGLVQRLAAHAGSTWSGRIRPQGFVLELVYGPGKPLENKNGRRFRTRSGFLTVEGSVFLPGRTQKGPFMLIGLVASPVPSSKATAQVVQAYLHPLLDAQSLLLVDSGLERSVFKKLVQVLMHRSDRGKNWDFRIRKPLIDFPTSTGPCRPDFIVDVGNERRVIEVMGMTDDAYFASKDVTHPRMRELATRAPWNTNDAYALLKVNDEHGIGRIANAWLSKSFSPQVANDPEDG